MITFILSLSPFLIFLFFLIAKRISLLKTSLITLLFSYLIYWLYWKIFPQYLIGSFIKGFFVALDIFLIIFGALFFLEVLKSHKIIDSLAHHLESVSKDYRVQVILIAWFLENFIEGTAGFGTPTAIAAPILVTLSFSPLSAVILSLLGNSTSVAFGAAGTPIKVGFQGINLIGIPLAASLFNLVGFIVPIFMLWVATNQKAKSKNEFWQGVPFAIWSGLCFTVPSVLTVFLGQEFPSILGSIIAILLVLVSIKLKVFTPKKEIIISKIAGGQKSSIIKVLAPYSLLILLLLVGKFALAKASLTTSVFSDINHTFNLYNPGLIFIISALPFAFLWLRKKLIINTLSLSFKKALEPFLVIVFMSTFVQLMIYSGKNFSLLPSSLEILARGISNKALPFLAPFLGGFGSFITGSATISNLMFGNILTLSSLSTGFNPTIILSLSLVGAAAGNIIALADMLTAEVVVGLKNKEVAIIKRLIIPCGIYIFLAGILGLIFA